ncbi:MAG TPA: HAD-IB family hydrolase [Bacteroidia bacterium]|nr:HAD-IB family hydrolase [Bacteroidia bacterium]
MNCLVLFDFDGTLTARDSFIAFIRATNSPLKFYSGFILLSPVLILYKFGIIPNWKAKQAVIRYFYGGMKADKFFALSKDFSEKHILKLVKESAMLKLREHINGGHQVVIVTASLEPYMEAWCKTIGVELIATRLEVAEGKITGDYSGGNCYGIEKANRIRGKYSLSSFEKIIAYGDSRGDEEMLELADEKHYRVF